MSEWSPSRKNPRPLPWTLTILLALALLALGGCFSAWTRPEKPAVSVLWVGSDVEALEASTVSRLKEAGVEELFIPVAELDLAADSPLTRIPTPDLPPTTAVTLVIQGDWAIGSRDPGEVAGRVAEAVQQLRFDVEARGVIPVGVHFDLLSVGSLPSYADFLKRLRKDLDRTLFLSVSLPRPWMAEPEVREVAEAVDFVVAFLYGQRLNEREDSDAWDYAKLKQHLEVIEQFRAPYMVGVIGLGTVTHESSQGNAKARTTRQSLHTFLLNRDLKLHQGFSLEGVNRRVYSLIAQRPTTVGGWNLKPREKVRVVRAATSDLEELLRVLAEGSFPNLLGQLYYRVPSPEERLSLTIDNIINALDPAPASPDPVFVVQAQRRTGRGWLYRFGITNRNDEFSELSVLESNYLAVSLPERNSFGAVQAGDFYRYDFYRRKADGTVERMYRNANVLHLYVGFLEGRQEMTSGDIEIRMRQPRFELTGKFLMADGRTIEVGPYSWYDGELHEPVEEGAEEGAEEGVDEESGE
ncbi:MAG: hypothetical protein GY856_20395 [bacterium]|nr:hypothetical protein [bacterium]